MESVTVLRRELLFLVNSISHTRHLNLCGICEGSKVDFHSDNISSHGPPKVVCQSLSSCV